MTNLRQCCVSASLNLIIFLTRHRRLIGAKKNTRKKTYQILSNIPLEILENFCLILKNSKEILGQRGFISLQSSNYCQVLFCKLSQMVTGIFSWSKSDVTCQNIMSFSPHPIVFFVLLCFKEANLLDRKKAILFQQPTNCFSMFDHFVGLALKGLTHRTMYFSKFQNVNM